MKMNLTLDKETQKELSAEGFSFHHQTFNPSVPSWLVEAAKKSGKVAIIENGKIVIK